MNSQIAIKNNSAWKVEVEETEDYLQVIDDHPEWCGPCKAIQNTFKKVFFDLSEKPLKFYTAPIDKINALADYKEHSEKPIFLFYQNGEKIHEQIGCDPPKLIHYIEKHFGIE